MAISLPSRAIRSSFAPSWECEVRRADPRAVAASTARTHTPKGMTREWRRAMRRTTWAMSAGMYPSLEASSSSRSASRDCSALTVPSTSLRFVTCSTTFSWDASLEERAWVRRAVRVSEVADLSLNLDFWPLVSDVSFSSSSSSSSSVCSMAEERRARRSAMLCPGVPSSSTWSNSSSAASSLFDFFASVKSMADDASRP
mmetsp:Transcript_16771/g.27117  ORF Transcript_16771/g.27117 Transcript_16771/m.27117 type:complete len:200 (-) Transcript_16771:39-638(-)